MNRLTVEHSRMQLTNLSIIPLDEFLLENESLVFRFLGSLIVVVY